MRRTNVAGDVPALDEPPAGVLRFSSSDKHLQQQCWTEAASVPLLPALSFTRISAELQH